MIYFFDTSALLKRYRNEAGTEIIDKIMSEKAARLVICSFSICEVARALDRHVLKKEISVEDLEKIIDLFYRDIRNLPISIVEMGRERLFTANDLILSYHLGTADAVILASALSLRTSNPIFVCADSRSGLLQAARTCRLSTLNPLSA